MKKYGSSTTRLLKTNINKLNISFGFDFSDMNALHAFVI